jgi:hypothetical protein
MPAALVDKPSGQLYMRRHLRTLVAVFLLATTLIVEANVGVREPADVASVR